MQNKRVIFALVAISMLAIIALLYAGVKKPTPVRIERVASEASRDSNAIEKINRSPEFSQLPAHEKVRALAKELRDARSAQVERPKASRNRVEKLQIETKPKIAN